MRYIRIVSLSELALDPIAPPSSVEIERILYYYFYREYYIETGVYILNQKELLLYSKMLKQIDLHYRVIGSVIYFERYIIKHIKVKGDLIYLVADRPALSI